VSRSSSCLRWGSRGGVPFGIGSGGIGLDVRPWSPIWFPTCRRWLPSSVFGYLRLPPSTTALASHSPRRNTHERRLQLRCEGFAFLFELHAHPIHHKTQHEQSSRSARRIAKRRRARPPLIMRRNGCGLCGVSRTIPSSSAAFAYSGRRCSAAVWCRCDVLFDSILCTIPQQVSKVVAEVAQVGRSSPFAYPSAFAAPSRRERRLSGSK